MTPNTPHGRTGTETEIRTDDVDETKSGSEGRNATGKYEKRDAGTTTGTGTTTTTVTGTGAERSETVPDEAGPPPRARRRSRPGGPRLTGRPSRSTPRPRPRPLPIPPPLPPATAV